MLLEADKVKLSPCHQTTVPGATSRALAAGGQQQRESEPGKREARNHHAAGLAGGKGLGRHRPAAYPCAAKTISRNTT